MSVQFYAAVPVSIVSYTVIQNTFVFSNDIFLLSLLNIWIVICAFLIISISCKNLIKKNLKWRGEVNI